MNSSTQNPESEWPDGDPDEAYIPSYHTASHPLLFLAALGAIIVCAWFGASILLPRVPPVAESTDLGLVSTPTLIGLDEEDAVAALQARGLPADVERQPNATAPPGAVTSQTPGPGARVPAGTLVNVSVSAGSGFNRVPQLEGSPRPELEAILHAHDLALGELTYAQAETPLDETVEQSPSAGELVTSGTPINVTLSSGPALVEIPDIRDLSPAEAYFTLSESGLISNVRNQFSWSVRSGDAMATEPAAGEEVPRGSHVTVIISDGPPPTTTTRPPPTTAPPTTEPPTTAPPTTAGPPPSTVPPPPAYEHSASGSDNPEGG